MTASAPQRLRVCSVPSDHPYVHHLTSPDAAHDPVVRLPDPPVAGAPAGRWWPPPALEADWVREHAAEFDVHHVHFGFEGRTAAELTTLVGTLRELGVPLVVTVHDLENPHTVDQSEHEARLSVLLAAADAVLTLTSGAAAEIRSRWGRAALVVPHPHVLPADRLGWARPPRRTPPVVGLHLKSLRGGTDRRLPGALSAAMAGGPGTLRVDLHAEVLDAGFPRHDAPLVTELRALQDAGSIDLVVHERFSDDELWAYLGGLDVSVLPYTNGTHSGWVELCHDLGTAVVAPDHGYWGEQQVVHAYPTGPLGADVAALRSAVNGALTHPAAQADPESRRRQRVEVARTHAEVYASVLRAVGP